MNYTIYKKFKANPSINPITGRKIKKNGPVYNKLMKECQKFKKTKKTKKTKKIKKTKKYNKKGGSYKTRSLTTEQKEILKDIKIKAEEQSEEYDTLLFNKFIEEIEDIVLDGPPISSKSYKELFQDFLKYIRSNMILTLHFNGDLMDKLTESGRIKSAYEIAEVEQRGDQYMNARTEAEEEQLGYTKQTKHIDRPKYGCLNIKKTSEGCAKSYGEYWLELSPKLINRITLTPNDSLNTWQKENPQAFARRREDYDTDEWDSDWDDEDDYYDYDEHKEITNETVFASDIGTPYHMNHILFKNWKDEVLFNFIHEKVNKKLVPNMIDEYDNNYIEIQIHGDISLESDVIGLHYPEFHKLSNKTVSFCEKFSCKVNKILKTPNQKLLIGINNLNIRQMKKAIALGASNIGTGVQYIKQLAFDDIITSVNVVKVKDMAQLLVDAGFILGRYGKEDLMKTDRLMNSRKNKKWGNQVIEVLRTGLAREEELKVKLRAKQKIIREKKKAEAEAARKKAEIKAARIIAREKKRIKQEKMRKKAEKKAKLEKRKKAIKKFLKFW